MSEQHDARPDDAPAMPDDRPQAGACPFLGLAADPPSRFDFPSSEHRCGSAAAPVYVELAHQATYCLTSRHVSCPRFPGPDAVSAGAAPQPPLPPEAPPEAPPEEPPVRPTPTTRASYTLAARGGFGALAATPRGWVPVETSTPAPAPPAAAPTVAPTEPAGPAAPTERAEPVAPTEPAGPAEPTERAEPVAPTEPAPDPEGLGALVVAGVAGELAASEPVPAGVVDAAPGADVLAQSAATAPGAAPGAGPGTDAAAEGAAPPVTTADAPEVASAEGPADGTPVPEGPADGTPVPEGPAALEVPVPGPGIGARLAGIGRNLLRGLAIVLAAVLVLAALVGLGYGAGKLLVRPGEVRPSAASTSAPATPLVTPPGRGPSEAPGAGAATAPAIPGASATPVASAPGAATAPPTPTAKPTTRPTPKPRVYVVKSGDTLFGIAARFGVTVNAIIAANDITDPNAILPGQRLTIPRP